MQVYKALHLDKIQGAIFSPETNIEKSGGKKNLVKGYKRELYFGTNKTMIYQLPIAC